MVRTQPFQAFLKIESGSHSAPVHSLIPFDRSKRLITAGSDKTIRIWDVAARKEARKILGEIGSGQVGDVAKIALTPDERTLAAVVNMGEGSTGNDCILRFYDLESGDLRKVLHLGGTVSALDFTAARDGYFLAVSWMTERRIRVLKLNTALEQTTAPGQVELPFPLEPMLLKFYRKGEEIRLITANWDNYAGTGNIGLYRLSETVGESRPGLEPSRQYFMLPNRDSPEYFALHHPWIAVAEHRKPEIYILNLDGDLRYTIPSDPHPAGLAFSPDGRFLLAGSKGPQDQYVCTVYDSTSDFVQTAAYAGHDGPIYAVGFLDENNAVSAGGAGFEIHFWDARSGTPSGDPIRGAGRSIFAVGIQGEDRIAFGIHQRFQLDANNFAPLENVLSLKDFSISPIDVEDAAGYQRAKPEWGSFSLKVENANLWLQPRQVPLTGWRAGWYFAETFGFSSEGDILLGERGGQVRVFPRDRDVDLESLRQPENRNPWDFDEPWDFTRAVFLRGHAAGQVWDHAAQGRWLVTGGNDQVIRLWNLAQALGSTAEEMLPALNLFITNEHEWVAWSESGYYAASQNGDKYIGFQVNQGEDQEGLFFPCDRFLGTLYRPDVIRAILETGSEASALEMLGLTTYDVGDILPPVIELKSLSQVTTPAREVTLRFEVRPLGKPVQRVFALRNDQFIWQDNRPELAQGATLSPNLPLLPGKNEIKLFAESADLHHSNPTVVIVHSEETGARAASLDPKQLDVSFTLVPGDETLSEVRLERDGETVWRQADEELSAGSEVCVSVPLTGKTHQIVVVSDDSNTSRKLLEIDVRAASPVVKLRGDGQDTGAQTDQKIKPDLFLLAVGVSSFQHQDSLKSLGLENLDYAHKDALAVESRFKTQEGKLYNKVYSRVLVNNKATRKNILKELQDLQDANQTREGEKKEQGFFVRDLTILFLAGHGIERDGNFYFLSFDAQTDLEKTAIRLMDLGQQITSLPSDLILLTDTCRSGMVGRELIRTLDPSELAKRLWAINERAQIIFNATTADSTSREGGRVEHGFFTAGLLEGLQKGSQVMALELVNYVQSRVKEMSENKQIPTLRTYGDIYPLPIYMR